MDLDDDEYDPRAHDHLVEPLFAGLGRAEPRSGGGGRRRGCGGAAALLALVLAGLLLAA